MKPGNSPTVSPFFIDIPNDSREVISIGSTRVFEYWLSFSRMCLRSFNMMISFVVIEFVLLEDLFITNLVIYQYIPFFFLFSIPKITPINGKNLFLVLTSPFPYIFQNSTFSGCNFFSFFGFSKKIVVKTSAFLPSIIFAC